MHKFRNKKKNTIDEVKCTNIINLGDNDQIMPLSDGNSHLAYIITYKYNHCSCKRALVYRPDNSAVLGVGPAEDYYWPGPWEKLCKAAKSQAPTRLKFIHLGHMPLTIKDKELLDKAVQDYNEALIKKVFPDEESTP